MNHQILISGAPGTGKSYLLQTKCQKSNYSVTRTIFSPEYTYNTFVGSYFPVSIEDSIQYQFNPGPLLIAFVEAMLNFPTRDHVLIIEEVNRGRVNSIFGDIFQLLDRSQDGWSEYDISLSPAAMLWLCKQIKSKLNEYTDEEISLVRFSKLIKPTYLQNFKENPEIFVEHLGTHHIQFKLPSNLHIWGTINPSDSGTASLDTAFIRRWFIDQIPLDSYCNSQGKHTWEEDLWNPVIFGQSIHWQQVRKLINTTLLTNFHNFREDQCFGPYFLSQTELSGNHKIELFCNKVLSYIWFVVFKYEDRSKFFNTTNLRSFQDINIVVQQALQNTATDEELWDSIFSIDFVELNQKIPSKSYPLPQYWQ